MFVVGKQASVREADFTGLGTAHHFVLMMSCPMLTIKAIVDTIAEYKSQKFFRRFPFR